MSDSLLAQLQDGVEAMGLVVNDLPLQAYISYIELLAQWNQAYNLTAIRDPEKMLAYHILDSLAVLPYVKGEHCLDIGSGAGLPGLVLALARPEQRWFLLDSNGKKIRFINQAIIELGISNVETVYCRIEDFSPDFQFSTIIARAWSKLLGLYNVATHLLQAEGRILALKGPDVLAELDELDKKAVNFCQHKLEVPGVEGERMLIELSTLLSCK